MDKILQDQIYEEVLAERKYQEAIWDGCQNTKDEWAVFCAEYALANSKRTAGRDFRERMVKVAALAFAAIEAVDEETLAE